MKPELVTIQKIRLIQLCVMALLAVMISFYAGYCFRGPGAAETKIQDHADGADEAAGDIEKVIRRIEPTAVDREVSPAAEPVKAGGEKGKLVRELERGAAPVANTPKPAEEKPAPVAPAEPAAQPVEKSAKPAPKEAKSSAPTKKEPAPASGNKYTLQVGAYKDFKDAEKIVETLTRKNFPAYLRSVVIKGEKWHRVRVGTYSSADDAKKAAARLETQNKLKAMIVKYD